MAFLKALLPVTASALYIVSAERRVGCVYIKQRCTEEFRIEAIRQVTERGYSVAEVAGRLGMTTHSSSIPVRSLCHLLEVHPIACDLIHSGFRIDLMKAMGVACLDRSLPLRQLV